MKISCYIVLALIIYSTKLVVTKSELCSYNTNECELCEIDNNNLLSLSCSTENKTEYDLLTRINFDSQIFYLNYSFYSLILVNNKNFRILPSFLFKHIEMGTLDLAKNEIESISNDTFSSIKSLNILILNSNKIKSIENLIIGFTSNIYLNSKGQFESLTEINLKDNEIDSLNTPFTTAFSLVNILGLSNNQIEVLKNGVFGRLLNLKVLDLENNKLNSISENMFTGLNNLTTLYLNLNQIRYINPFSFKDLKRLFDLTISNNQIDNIDNLTFNGLNKLYSLRLNNNNLVYLSKDMLSSLPNLKELSVSSNIINHIDQDAFMFTNKLTKLYLSDNLLDLSNNCIQNLENLEDLDLRNNRIRKLDKIDLNLAKSLKRFYLKSNYLTSIKSLFIGFEVSNMIQYLDLSLNNLALLGNDDFGIKFQNLESIYLEQNKIAKIETDTFKYTKKLYSMNLKQNHLIVVNNFTFSSLNKLRYLQMSKNSLSTIFRETLIGLNSLENLFLDENYISHLNDFVFAELTAIQSIELTNNQIVFVSDKMFNCSKTGSSSLKYLYLGYNNIRDLKFLKSCLSKLQIIHLFNNQIERIEKNYFESVPSLKSIDLSYNRIIFIEKYSFLNFKNLILKNMSSSSSILFRINFVEYFSTDLADLDLSFNRLEFTHFNASVSFVNLNTLNLNNCFLEDIFSLPFKSFLNLNEFDFSNNYLNISQNKTIDIFSMIPNIQYLSLRNVQLDSVSHIGSFIPAEVVYLDLSYNNIETIEKKQFRKNTLNLMTIGLSFNSIEIIEKDAFYDLNIVHLDLSNNRIKNLRTHELFNSLELNTLIMTNNLILNMEQLSRNYFEKMSKMIFSFNSLEKFECEIYFNNRNKLSKLFLNNNLLKEISNKSFYILNKLKELHINSNEIYNIEPNAFYSLDKMEILNMDQNKIKILDSSLFKKLFRLKNLNLSSNSLQFIQANLLSSLYNLITLDLSHNDLIIIEPFSMLSMEKLKDLYINANLNLAIGKNCLAGLKSVENIYVNMETILNETNRQNLLESINLTLSKVVLGRKYFKSLNLISQANTEKNIDTECFIIFYFLKLNYFVNLKTDYDVNEFLRKCEKVK